MFPYRPGARETPLASSSSATIAAVHGLAAADSALARNLGARGSRAPIGHDDPAGDPGEAARAVLAGVADGWAVKARAAGLDGPWLDVHEAIGELEPPPSSTSPANLDGLTGSEVGARY